jgi:hypothetical protein
MKTTNVHLRKDHCLPRRILARPLGELGLPVYAHEEAGGDDRARRRARG